MGFKSLFPFFNRDEVTPSEPDTNPDVESTFKRVLARIQGFSDALGVFKFIRSDYNGKLHVTQAPTNFENVNFADVIMTGALQVLAPANPDRQEIWILNIGPTVPTISIRSGGNVIFSYGIPIGNIDIFRGLTQEFDVTAPSASGTVRFVEF